MAKKKRSRAEKFCSVPAAPVPEIKFPAPFIWLVSVAGIVFFAIWFTSPQFKTASFSYFFYHFNGFLSCLNSGMAAPLPGYLLQTLVSMLLIAGCHGAGRFILSFLKKDFSFPELFSFSFATGCLLLATWTFFLSVFHMLYPAAEWLFTVTGITAGFLSFKKLPLSKPGLSKFYLKLPAAEKTICFLLLLFAVFGYISSLTPEIFFDSLVYHLGVPNLWLAAHGFVNIPDNIYSNLFMFHGMIYSAGLSMLYSSTVPKLLNFYALAVTAVSLYGTADRIFSDRLSIWASIFFISFILVSSSVLYAGTETFSSMFIMLSLAAALRAVQESGNQEDQKRQNTSFFILSGLYAGCAMSVKATCLLYSASLILAVFFHFRRTPAKAVRPILIFTAAAALIVFPWLLKNLIYCSGNPFFPFGTSVFGIPEGYTAENISAFMADTNPRTSFLSWLIHPWNILRGNLSGSDLFSPLFFLLLLFTPFTMRFNPALQFTAVFSCAGWLLWSFFSDMPRFVLPVLPAASVAAVSVLQYAGRKLKKTLKTVILIHAFFMWLVFFSLIGNQGRFPVLFNRISAENYLSHMHNIYPAPAWPVIQYANKHLDINDRILFLGDSRTFYLKRQSAAASVFNREPLAVYAAGSADGDEMYSRIIADGFTHILFNPGEGIRTKTYRQFADSHTRHVFNDFYNRHLSVVNFYNEQIQDQIINTVFLMKLTSTPLTEMPPNYFEKKIREEESRGLKK